ncbi:MAG: hypothetical protein HFJ55_07685 [Clostridia bacterium]|nr:hypothetical protein [Clostridia bacterium]
MHKLRRFYYNNKTKIWAAILFITFLIIILQVINYVVGLSNNKKAEELLNNNTTVNSNTNSGTNTTTNTTQKENSNTSVTSEKSGVTGVIVQKEQLERASNLIDSFITFCNEQKLEEAYNLLSDECKEENYKTIDKFINLYYKENFSSNVKTTAVIENWVSNIYLVDMSEDMLSTGKVSTAKKRDYMTIVQQNGEYKLNIHSFIDREEINKEWNANNITFKVVSKNIYMDYEEYVVQVNNMSGNSILLDTMKSTKTIYLEDANKAKFYCYTNEIIKDFLNISNGSSSQLKLRFMRKYSSSRKDVSLIFSDIILNYNGTIDGNTERRKVTLNI